MGNVLHFHVYIMCLWMYDVVVLVDISGKYLHGHFLYGVCFTASALPYACGM